MKFVNKNYYEILNVPTTASDEQIRRAYGQAKATWQPDSVAIYSLYTADECAAISHKLEEAYQLLTHPEHRASYDRYLRLADSVVKQAQFSPERFWDLMHGLGQMPDEHLDDVTHLLTQEMEFDPRRPDESRISRGAGPSDVAQLVGSPTAHDEHPEAFPERNARADRGLFRSRAHMTVTATKSSPIEPLGEDDTPASPSPEEVVERLANPGLRLQHDSSLVLRPGGTEGPSEPTPAPVAGSWSRSVPRTVKMPSRLPDRPISPEVLQELELKHGLGGAFLRTVREIKGIDLQDISDRTKIQLGHLRGLEQEKFRDLPPEVYVEGFVNQVARLLKLDAAHISAEYMKRYRAAAKGGE